MIFITWACTYIQIEPTVQMHDNEILYSYRGILVCFHIRNILVEVMLHGVDKELSSD